MQDNSNWREKIIACFLMMHARQRCCLFLHLDVEPVLCRSWWPCGLLAQLVNFGLVKSCYASKLISKCSISRTSILRRIEWEKVNITLRTLGCQGPGVKRLQHEHPWVIKFDVICLCEGGGWWNNDDKKKWAPSLWIHGAFKTPFSRPNLSRTDSWAESSCM